MADPYSTPDDVRELFGGSRVNSYVPDGTSVEEPGSPEYDADVDAFLVLRIAFGDAWLDVAMGKEGQSVPLLAVDRPDIMATLLRDWSVVSALHHWLGATDQTKSLERRWKELLDWLAAGACLIPGEAPDLVSVVTADPEDICPSIPPKTFRELVACAGTAGCP